MSEILSEIDDDIRAAKLRQFWMENGAWIIGSIIAAVLLTGVLTVWRQWDHRNNMRATSELVRVAATADLKQLEAFGATGRKNQAMVARFVAAGAHLNKGEKDQAVALYNDIAETRGLDKTWKQLAKILSISQRLDKDDPAKLEKELSRLSGDKDAWRYTARELEALLAARQKQPQKAVDILTKVTADTNAPADIRARAFALRELYMGDIAPAAKTDPKT